MVDKLRVELEEVTAALQAHKASWAYAFAMAGGCHGGSEHPSLRAVRAETDRLYARCVDLRARLAEHNL